MAVRRITGRAVRRDSGSTRPTGLNLQPGSRVGASAALSRGDDIETIWVTSLPLDRPTGQLRSALAPASPHPARESRHASECVRIGPRRRPRCRSGPTPRWKARCQVAMVMGAIVEELGVNRLGIGDRPQAGRGRRTVLKGFVHHFDVGIIAVDRRQDRVRPTPRSATPFEIIDLDYLDFAGR